MSALARFWMYEGSVVRRGILAAGSLLLATCGGQTLARAVAPRASHPSRGYLSSQQRRE